MPVLVTRGPKYGQCNICGSVGPLTEDHTPPKSCVRPTTVQLQHLAVHLDVERPKEKAVLSQNGVKYRTLCASCNNEMLGRRYDPALATFTNSIAHYITSPIALPSHLTVRAAPQKIMRSVFGHMSAQGVNRYLKGKTTEQCRDYFLDGTLPLPDDLKIYYWLYPHQKQILVRDAAYLDLRIGTPAMIWLMKFFPLAFAVLWDDKNAVTLSLPELSQYRGEALNFETELPVTLRPVLHPYWPEAPSDTHVMAYGREAVFAVTRKKS